MEIFCLNLGPACLPTILVCVYLQQFLHCSFANCRFRKLIIFATHTMTISLSRYYFRASPCPKCVFAWAVWYLLHSYLFNSPLTFADQSRLPGIRSFNWWAIGFSSISGARLLSYGMQHISFLLPCCSILPFACFLLVGMSAWAVTSMNVPLWGY